MRYTLLTICLFLVFRVCAQSTQYDSLVSEYNSAANDRDRFDLVISLLVQPNQTREVYESWFGKAHELANSIDNDTLRIRALSLNGRRQLYSGEDADGLKQMIEGMRIAENMKDSSMMAGIHYMIGAYYFWKQDQRLAQEHFEKSLKIYPVIGSQTGRASSLMGLAIMLQDKGEFEEALKCHQEGIEIRKKENQHRALPTAYTNLSELYIVMGDTTNALLYLEKSIRLSDSLGITASKVYASFLKGEFLTDQNRAEEAIPDLEYAIAWWEEKKSLKELPRALKKLATAYKMVGDYQKSVAVLEKMTLVKDSLFNEAKMTAVQDIETKYETEKKEIELAKRTKEKEWAKKETELVKEQEKTQRIVFIIVAILLVVNAVYFFSRYKKQKKDKLLIEAQKLQIEARSQEIEDSINYAKRIQTAVLPSDSRIQSYGLDSFILYKPKDIVAGDFYWFEQKGDTLLFAAADCTGHGVPGAMVSMICNNALNRSVREFDLENPGKILDQTREIVIQEFEKSEEEVKDGMDIALCALSSNASGKAVLQYAGAHNPLWIIRNETGELEEVKADKQPVGKSDKRNLFTSHKFELSKGDIFYIFSDGFADQFGGERGKKYKSANFKRLLISVHKEPLSTQRKLIEEAFYDWKGSLEQLDDVCVIGMRV